MGAEHLDRKKYFEGLMERLTVDLDEENRSMDVDGAEGGDRNPLDHNSDSDEESWLGDGEESDDEEHKSTGNQIDNSSESNSPSPSIDIGSAKSASSEPGTSKLDDDRAINLARRKNDFLESITLHRRIFPPFVRLPRSSGQRDAEGDEEGKKESVGPHVAPWSLLALMSQGSPTSPEPRLTSPPTTSSRDRKRKSSPSSTSSYSDSSTDSRGSSDLLPENDDDLWLASEDNLDFKDVEQETEYEKSLWAMFATDETSRDETPPNDNGRTKRKRQQDSQEEIVSKDESH